MNGSSLKYLVSLAVIGLAACAPVRLLEGNDPRIEQGMAEYQEALETFVRQTLFNYRQCEANRAEAESLAAMSCEGTSDAVVEACEAQIQQQRAEAEQAAASACRAASFTSGQESFYIPEAARLSVLRSRAAVLDSAGVCGAAAEGVARFVNALVPPRIRDVTGGDSGEPNANCTEILVQTVVENHDALAAGHQLITDEIAAEENAGGLSLAEQAEAFFGLQLDTLVQNVRIVLVLEEAKKRGNTTR